MVRTATRHRGCTPRHAIHTATLTASLLAIIAVAGCHDAGSGPASAADGPPTVVATTGIWADVVSNVACDGQVRVVSLVPPGGDPHEFEPSLADRSTMSQAALVVSNGLGLEQGLTTTIEAVAADGVPVFAVGDHVETRPIGQGVDRRGDGSGSEAASSSGRATDADPHLWQDPTLVRSALPALADALVKNAHLDRAPVDACLAAYTDRLTALDEQVAATLATVPKPYRKLVTSHDSLGYFAHRYGFEVIGTVIPSASTMAETNPAALERLARIVADSGVGAVFAETEHSSGDTEALADRVGDVQVVTLSTDTLGEPGTASDSYVGFMASNAKLVAGALGEGG